MSANKLSKKIETWYSPANSKWYHGIEKSKNLKLKQILIKFVTRALTIFSEKSNIYFDFKCYKIKNQILIKFVRTIISEKKYLFWLEMLQRSLNKFWSSLPEVLTIFSEKAIIIIIYFLWTVWEKVQTRHSFSSVMQGSI